ncbi:uncharacterized protein EURHEDRAFT_407959 [Aspergillus ruber CBS 135680]|uniref:Uncharacterized protein n=1 Tax=Aspergillus ruber (strain CBS 135680) TaxID=1388766 RepID=A0A017STL9_ASPRC|nr:uncharacterized protein EURHEDRAFT_407959 [Aspergillus ruber CBS 135680]EYE99949.1 hypothetical protein EURHEDRAFT_407959 [Aspergillus ruber CBS 135680]
MDLNSQHYSESSLVSQTINSFGYIFAIMVALFPATPCILCSKARLHLREPVFSKFWTT